MNTFHANKVLHWRAGQQGPCASPHCIQLNVLWTPQACTCLILISYCCCNQLTQIDLHIHMHTILFSNSFIDQKSYVGLTARKWRLGQSCAPFGDSEDNSFPCLFWFQKASHSPFSSSFPLQSQEETASKISLTLTTASRSHVCNCQKPLDGTTPKANTKWWTLGSNWSRQVISCSFQTSTPEGECRWPEQNNFDL